MRAKVILVCGLFGLVVLVRAGDATDIERPEAIIALINFIFSGTSAGGQDSVTIMRGSSVVAASIAEIQRAGNVKMDEVENALKRSGCVGTAAAILESLHRTVSGDYVISLQRAAPKPARYFTLPLHMSKCSLSAVFELQIAEKSFPRSGSGKLWVYSVDAGGSLKVEATDTIIHYD